MMYYSGLMILLILIYQVMINITNEDNMDLMSKYEDNHFDLAIVDPPYGIGIDGQKENIKDGVQIRKAHTFKDRDWETDQYQLLSLILSAPIKFPGEVVLLYAPGTLSYLTQLDTVHPAVVLRSKSVPRSKY